MTDPSTAGDCDDLAARGWVLRCGRGGTVHTSVYCDRAAAAGGGCSAAPGAGRRAQRFGGAASGALALGFMLRRRARVGRAREA